MVHTLRPLLLLPSSSCITTITTIFDIELNDVLPSYYYTTAFSGGNPLLLVWEWCTHEIGREREKSSSENITVFHLVAIQMPRHSHTETIIISVGISIKDIKQKAVRIIKFRLAGVACCRHSNCISCLLCFLLLVELHYISHTLDD